MSRSKGRLKSMMPWTGKNWGAIAIPRIGQEVVIDFLHDKIGIQKRHQFLKNKKALTKAKLLKLVSEDKKMTSPSHVNFVFLEKAGKAFRKTVTIDSFLTEAARQGWVTS